MGQRRRAREYALQMLYQIDQAGGSVDDLTADFWRNQPGAETEVREFSEEIVRGVLDRRQDLDRRIAESAESWRLDRIAVVERNILRLAAWELGRPDGAPPAVVSDEAIEIAKRFGSAESGGFINGVLDRLRELLAAEEST